MSKYSEIEKEFNEYFKNRDVHLDEFDDKSISIVSYEDLDSDDLTSIEEEIFGFSKPILWYISPRYETNEGIKSYVLLEYKADIGKDYETEEELYQRKIDDDEEDRRYENYKESKLE